MPASDNTTIETSHQGDVPEGVIESAVDKVLKAVVHTREPIQHIDLRLVLEPDPARERPAICEVGVDVDGVPIRVQVAAATGDLAFFVHIYSFRTRERADSYVRRWNHPGYSITVRSQVVRGVDWYRIYLGPFATRGAALLDALRLKQDETIDYYKVIQLPEIQRS